MNYAKTPIGLVQAMLDRGARFVTINLNSVGPLDAEPVHDCEQCGGDGFIVVDIDDKPRVGHCPCVAARHHEQREVWGHA